MSKEIKIEVSEAYTNEQFDELQLFLKDLSDEYHTILIGEKLKQFRFQMFDNKDFTVIKSEELNQSVKDQIWIY